jgi:hypothetical protein
MLVADCTFYNHYVKIGNDDICIQLDEKLSEEQLLKYITKCLVGFDIDKQNKELLFYRGTNRSGIMAFWFSFPAQETTLTMDSNNNELSNEFYRIYNLWKAQQQ